MWQDKWQMSKEVILSFPLGLQWSGGKLRIPTSRKKNLMTCCSSICMRSLSPSLAFFTSSNSLFVLMHSFIFSSSSLFNRNISLCIRSEFVCAGVMPCCCSSCDFISLSCKWSRFTYSSRLASYFCHFAFKSSTWKITQESCEEHEDTNFHSFHRLSICAGPTFSER